MATKCSHIRVKFPSMKIAFKFAIMFCHILKVDDAEVLLVLKDITFDGVCVPEPTLMDFVDFMKNL
jgi:hypothetical protein